ncbi:MAG TPA: hypothetical protein VK699_20650 [Terriglobales bacterium]|jgi:hypothetical protein|nr:hypothetical protein [Terriglobales bacterium]
MKKICMFLAGVLVLATAVFAQMAEPALPPPPGASMMFFQKGEAGPEIIGAKPYSYNYNYVYTTNIGDRRTITGAPYSATAVTESTQVLADGNRIVNKSSTFQARDSEGRTRREIPHGIGPLPVGLPQMVMISDPVSKTDYMLNPKEKTADVIRRVDGKGIVIQKFEGTGSGSGFAFQTKDGEPEQKIKIKIRGDADETAGPHVTSSGGEALRLPGYAGAAKPSKDLGTQVIEGVSCTGTRETRTIAAGAIGNEQPIEITTETWTSPELKTVVLSKHNDPRFGETVYQLTDIKRSEPDQSLFQVPSDYRVLGQDVVASPKD